MIKKLLTIYNKLEETTSSKIIVYVTGDRPGMETQINKDVVDIFGDHLEKIGKCKKITLLLYTIGGDTMATWNIINLMKEYCDEIDIIVPRKARSSGTIMCLGANTIFMTRQTTLGPIDPSITRPLGPTIDMPGQRVQLPTSVESVNGYFDLVKKELGIKDSQSLVQSLNKLTDRLHPLVLGDVYRVKSQIKMIASKLLGDRIHSNKIKNKIINFLCGDSGSHDYAISYTEAKQLGLNVRLVTEELNILITDWYNLISDQLKLRNKYDPVLELAQTATIQYKYVRAFIDSVASGRNHFVSEGTLNKIVQQIGVLNGQIVDTRIFEGWKNDIQK
jgi:hypothetical protein